MLPSMLMLGRCHYHCIRGTVSNWVTRPLPRQGQLSSHADGFSTTTTPAPRLHPSCSTLLAVPAVTSEHSGEASIAQQHHPRVPLLPQGNPGEVSSRGPQGRALEPPLLNTSGREGEWQDEKVYQLH